MTRNPRIFDSSLQTANLWLKAVEDRLLCEDRHAAYEALRAVLHVLRDRLPLEAVLGLSAQSPMLIRGLLLEGWRPQDGPSNIRDADAFGEVRKIIACLPQPLRRLWPEPGPLGAAADLPPAGTPARRRKARSARPRSGFLTGATIALAGGALTWALLVGAMQSGSVDPAQILLDPGLGLQRLAAGLLFASLVMVLGSGLAAFLIARNRRA